jgi:hypothetical protein
VSSDRAREIHGGGHDDSPSLGECIAEAEATVASLEAGDTSYVPPWTTIEAALDDARSQLARYRALA